MLFATSRDNSPQKNSQIVLFICRRAWKESPAKAAASTPACDVRCERASNTPQTRPRGEANPVSMSGDVSLQDRNLVTAPRPFTKLAFVPQIWLPSGSHYALYQLPRSQSEVFQ